MKRLLIPFLVQPGWIGVILGAWLLGTDSVMNSVLAQQAEVPIGGEFLDERPILRGQGWNGQFRDRDDLISIGGRSTVLGSDDSARTAVVVGGTIRTEGEVRNDLVVVGGEADVDGYIGGNVIIVASKGTFGPDADIQGDAVLIGGPFEIDPEARFGGTFHEFPLTWLLPAFDGLRQWFGGTLVLARPFGPNLPGVWWLVSGLFIVNLMVFLLLNRPTQCSVKALSGSPVTALLVGITVLLLLGPLLALLVFSGFGILLVPFVFCLALAALLVGKVAVYTVAGQTMLNQLGLKQVSVPLLGFALGSATFLVAYLIPIIGFMTLGLVLPVALGAVVVAGFQAFRGEGGGGGALPDSGGASTVTLSSAGGTASETEKPSSAGLGASSGIAATPSTSGTLSGSGTGTDPAALGAETKSELFSDSDTFDRVGFWPRIAATLLDLVLFVVVFAVFVDGGGPGMERFVIFFWLLYHCLMWRFFGTTVGGLILRLRCVTVDGESLSWGAALMRALVSVFSFVALLVGFFWASWGRDRQSWHDIVAGTTIIRMPRGVLAT